MKDQVEYYKLENRIQSSHESIVSKLKSSEKVISLLKKSKPKSFILQAPLTGKKKKMIKLVKSRTKPLTSSTLLTRRPDGTLSLMETGSNTIWAYLARDQVFFPMEKRMDYRQAGETPGYTIGGHSDCDIPIHHSNAEPNHALIYCKVESNQEQTTLATYLCNRSSMGTWVNSEVVKDQVQLFHNDIIHFFDPEKYSREENPSYLFVKPEYRTTSVYSIENLYAIKSKIGSGKFGVVYLGQCKKTKKLVAIKYISKKVLNCSPKSKSSLLREISVCMSFPVHPCIIQVSRLFEREGNVFIVMEYGNGGDLFDTVSSAEIPLKEYQVRIIFDQIAHAVAFLHRHGIVHRDIKLENVIMCDTKNLTVKLCDFGLSTFVKYGRQLETNCGTIMYAAPELIECEKGYGVEVDIWSLGVLLFTALAMNTPFHQASEDNEEEKEALKADIKKGQIDFSNPIWKNISEDARDLIKNMMTVDKKKRYNIQQVLEHPWLQNIENKETIKAGLKRNAELVEYLDRHCAL